MTLPAPITGGPVPPRAVPIGRAISDPRPVLYMGAVGSFVFGFVSVAAVLLAGYKIARRWSA